MNTSQLFLDILKTCNLFLRLFQSQSLRIVTIELSEGIALLIAFLEELIIVQATVVRRYAVEVAHVHSLGAFLVGEQSFVHLLTVTDTDSLNLALVATEQLTHSLGLGLDGTSGSLLDQQVAILTMLKGKQHQINSLFKAHDEAGHVAIGQSDRLVVADLVDPQRDNGTAAAHNVAVTGATDLGLAAITALGHSDLLFHSLGDTHGVDGICSLVGREADHALYAGFDSGGQYVIGTDDIGTHSFHGEELAGRNLLESCRMEYVVYTVHGVLAGLQVADIADIELDLVCHFRHGCLEMVAHIVLLLLVAGEDSDFTDVGVEETVEDGVAEGTGAAGDE